MEGTWIKRGSAALARGTALAALAWSLQAAPAMAQDETAEQASAEDAIIVTGTRIARPVGFNEPTPSTVFGSEQIADLAIVNAGDVMDLIPQNTAFASDAVAGITGGADVGSSFANLRGLNPSQGTRTLTLVNTRRFVPVGRFPVRIGDAREHLDFDFLAETKRLFLAVLFGCLNVDFEFRKLVLFETKQLCAADAVGAPLRPKLHLIFAER